MYAQPSDIESLWSRAQLLALADHDGDDLADAPRVIDALTSASAEIDGYVGVRHALPLPSAPVQLRQPCADIAVYRLATSGGGLTEDIRTRYEDARRFLEAVAAGRAVIDVFDPASDPAAPSAQGPRPIVASGPERIFSRDTTRGL